MKKFLRSYLLLSAVLSLVASAACLFIVYLNHIESAKNRRIREFDTQINSFWTQVDARRQRPDDSVYGRFAADLKSLPVQSDTLPSRYIDKVELDQAKYAELPKEIRKYVWQSDSIDSRFVVTPNFEVDALEYRDGGVSAVMRKIVPPPTMPSTSLFLWGWIPLYLLFSTAIYFAAKQDFEKECPGLVDSCKKASSSWLLAQFPLAPVPTTIQALGRLGQGIGSSYREYARHRKHAFRAQINELKAVLKRLDGLPSTKEVSELRTQAQQALEGLERSPETVESQLAKTLKKESQQAEVLAGLRSRVEKASLVLSAEEATKQAIEEAGIAPKNA